MRQFKLKDYLISILIVSVTLLYFTDKYFVPEGVETVNFLGFEVGNSGFNDILRLVYFAKMKLLILFFSITWYLTSENWWKPAILIIITLELFKLVNIFNPNAYYIDEIEFISSLPFTVPVIGLLILLSSKLNKFRLSKEISSSIDKEIDDVFFDINQGNLKKINQFRNKVNILKENSKHFNKKEYFEKLIMIRDEFYKSL